PYDHRFATRLEQVGPVHGDRWEGREVEQVRRRGVVTGVAPAKRNQAVGAGEQPVVRLAVEIEVVAANGDGAVVVVGGHLPGREGPRLGARLAEDLDGLEGRRRGRISNPDEEIGREGVRGSVAVNVHDVRTDDQRIGPGPGLGGEGDVKL